MLFNKLLFVPSFVKIRIHLYKTAKSKNTSHYFTGGYGLDCFLAGSSSQEATETPGSHRPYLRNSLLSLIRLTVKPMTHNILITEL